MKQTILLLALTVFSALTLPAAAQTGAFAVIRVDVGDERLRVDLVEPYQARWAITIATADNRIIERGHLLEEVARGDCAQACWSRTVRVLSAAGEETSRTQNLIDARTLAPIRTEQIVPDGTGLRPTFLGRDVVGRQDVGAFFHIPEHHRDIRGRLRRAAFEINNGPTGLYLSLMPHERMTTLRIPIVDVDAEDPLSVVDADYRVFNRQTVNVAGRTFDAVVIDAHTTYGYWQYWVVPEPPFVVRWLYVGPGGGRTMYTLTPAASESR